MRYIVLIVIATIGLFPQITHATTVSFSTTILPVRILVVDDRDRIVSIWNNVTVESISYALLVSRKHFRGPQLALTTEVLNQYQDLLPRLPLHVVGLIDVSSMSAEEEQMFYDRQLFMHAGKWQEVLTVLP